MLQTLKLQSRLNLSVPCSTVVTKRNACENVSAYILGFTAVCVPSEWVSGSESLVGTRRTVHASRPLLLVSLSCLSLFFFSSFQFSPHTHWFRHSQGERWVWSRRGESFAHRPACRGRYLLWELQDNPGLEICKCNLADLMWGCTNCIQCEQRMNREAALLAQPNFIWTSSSSLPLRVGVATEIRKSKNNSNLPAPLKKKNKKPNKQKSILNLINN